MTINNHSTPYQLRAESRTVRLISQRISPTVIRVSWNVPEARGGAGDTRAYYGIVVLLSNDTVKNVPVDGREYQYDNVGASNIHLADKIGNALVVFSCYNDVVTNYIDITDCPEGSSYYFTGYCVDSLIRYDVDGVYAYERKLNKDIPLLEASPSVQLYSILNSSITDDVDFNTPTPPSSITVAGTLNKVPFNITASYVLPVTYEEMIDAINYQFGMFYSDYQNNLPINTNAIWVDVPNEQVFQWTGFVNNTLIPSFFGSSDPRLIALNTLWLNDPTLKKWNGSAWITQNLINFPSSPISLLSNTIWFNGTVAKKWDGSNWLSVPTYVTNVDPTAPVSVDGFYWLRDDDHLFFISRNKLIPVNNLTFSPFDPLLPPLNSFWVNPKDELLYQWNGTSWALKTCSFGTNCNTNDLTTTYLFDTSTNQLFNLIADTEEHDFIILNVDPTSLLTGSYWFDTITSTLKVLDGTTWLACDLNTSVTNPLLPTTVGQNSFWYNTDTTVGSIYDGNQWTSTNFINNPTDPLTSSVGTYALDISSNILYEKTLTTWNPVSYIKQPTDPALHVVGEFWYDTNSNTLNTWNGLSYVNVMFSTIDPKPVVGFKWFKPSTSEFFIWDGSSYVLTTPDVYVSWNDGFVFSSTDTGGDVVLAINNQDSSFTTVLNGQLKFAQMGFDEVSKTPMQYQPGVGGNDGSTEERDIIVDRIKRKLGFPVYEVELTDDQIHDAIDAALRVLRTKTSVAYTRKIGFLEVQPYQTLYILSNKQYGHDKIVTIMKILRLPSSFLTAVGSQQIYGQLILQQLYQAGSFDLVSFHLLSSYVELLEKMFASKIQFSWNERTRELVLYNTVGRAEKVLLDAMIEKTENELFSDRYTENWIYRYALAESRETLAIGIRGKYSSLPGAGGGVSLEVSNLLEAARTEKEECQLEIDNYVIERPEEVGGHATFILG